MQPEIFSVAEHRAAIVTRMESAIKQRVLSHNSLPQLIAVSKFQPVEAIEAAIKAGQVDFGENHVQEMKAKWPALKKLYPQVRLHFIGHLQTNKAEEVVALADVIHSLDRPKLADALAKAFHKQGRQLPCYIQVNIGEEPQKGGVAPAELDSFLAYCGTTCNLPVEGLMCIPPEGESPAPYFALMHQLGKRYQLKLSMGMSGDFEEAIAFGADWVRVGTAIFGARQR
jgi:pyridoxal phosphate enzyme (YggS family)